MKENRCKLNIIIFFKIIFVMDFWNFFFKAIKKSFIRKHLLKGLLNINKYVFTYKCMNEINEKYNININIDEFNNFKKLYYACLDWKNETISRELYRFIAKGK